MDYLSFLCQNMKMWNFGTKRIYADTAAATTIDSVVLRVMLPYLSRETGNPSSLHQEGVRAHKAVEQARKQISDILGAHPDEIIFTGSGTEGDNLAILGVARGLLAKNKIKNPGHIITTAIEHQAVLESCQTLEKEGWQVTYLPVSKEGIVDLNALKESLREDTVLVSVMYANNEIGTIEPIREVAKILREHRKQSNELRLPYFHTDACQASRFLPLEVEKLGVDLMTLNGSKVYGPKGIGCLYVKRNTFISPILFGGGQERGLRSGTENVAGVVGLAKALALSQERKEKDNTQLIAVRDYFFQELRGFHGVKINGDLLNRLPNNVNVSFSDSLGEWLVLSLDARGVACSTGSACSAHSKDNSHVIMALGHDKNHADSALRFSLDRGTTKAHIDYIIKSLKEILSQNKNLLFNPQS